MSRPRDDSPPVAAALDDLGVEVRRLIASRVASARRPEELGDDTPLLGGGLGLDSVRVVELLFACEDRFGVKLPVEVLEDEEPTVGVLIREIAAAGPVGAADPAAGKG